MMAQIATAVLAALLGGLWGMWHGTRGAKQAARVAKVEAIAKAETLRIEVEHAISEQSDLVGLAHRSGLVRPADGVRKD